MLFQGSGISILDSLILAHLLGIGIDHWLGMPKFSMIFVCGSHIKTVIFAFNISYSLNLDQVSIFPEDVDGCNI